MLFDIWEKDVRKHFLKRVSDARAAILAHVGSRDYLGSTMDAVHQEIAYLKRIPKRAQ